MERREGVGFLFLIAFILRLVPNADAKKVAPVFTVVLFITEAAKALFGGWKTIIEAAAALVLAREKPSGLYLSSV
ncbi:hypothetical protein [Ruegeria atlantica]|uniref:hypothetical protein n=1 Tax=Ruegeria atlantica TaxID=81569 RepID=UPI0014801353|nr:hypothetical protein [Ruegeria atlantica]